MKHYSEIYILFYFRNMLSETFIKIDSILTLTEAKCKWFEYFLFNDYEI